MLADSFPGMATLLVNYEIGQYGGYRRINGFAPYDADYAEVTGAGKVLGVFIFNNKLYASRKHSGDGNYSTYVYTAGVGWGSTLNPSDTRSATGVTRLRHVIHTYTGTKTIIFVDGVNYPASYNGSSWVLLNGSSSINAAKYVAAFASHTFYAGMSGAINTVAFADPNTSGTFSSGYGVINVGFEVKGIRAFRDGLYVFGEENIKKITGTSSSNFALSDITQALGLVAHDSLVELGGDLVFLSQDGFRTISGTDKIGDVKLDAVSDNIKSELIDLGENYSLSDFIVVPYRTKTQLRAFLFDSATAVADSFGYVGGVRSTPDSTRAWEWGRLLGIQANCVTSGRIDGKEYVLHGDNGGNVMRQEYGSDFNGADILSLYVTPYLDFGTTENDKDMRHLHVFFRPEGAVTFNIGTSLDWGDENVTQPVDTSSVVSTIPVIYDDPNITWDGTSITWDGASRPSRKVPIFGNSASVRFIFQNASTCKPFSIQGFVVLYSTYGTMIS
jgi:hypothetical protein